MYQPAVSRLFAIMLDSFMLAGSLLLCQEYRRTARKCQRNSLKWLSTLSVIWQIITDFLKLLSDFEIYLKTTRWVLESWPVRCALSMHLRMWHWDCSTRMRCVDTFCWHLSLIYLYREDAWNVPVSLFFLNVVISLSLNDFAYNILNDELKIMFTWSCWKLALQ